MTKFERMLLHDGCPECHSDETYETIGVVNGDECRIAVCDECGHAEPAELWDELIRARDEKDIRFIQFWLKGF